MKDNTLEFVRRGLIACGSGPIILAVLYKILQHLCALQTLTVNQVCTGIVSLSALAFIAGGMNVVYQIERLALMWAILLHGSVLYFCYLGTYLLNGWLEWGTGPVLVFSCIFVLGYLEVWVVICCITKNRAARINEILKQKQQAGANE